MALISRKLALLYKQILKNSIAMTCCSLPDIWSHQEQPHFSVIFPHVGAVAWTDISLHCDTRYVPEPGSNSLDLEQPHLPRGSLTRRFLPHAGLWLSYLKFNILVLLHPEDPRGQTQMWPCKPESEARTENWTQLRSFPLFISFSLGQVESNVVYIGSHWSYIDCHQETSEGLVFPAWNVHRKFVSHLGYLLLLPLSILTLFHSFFCLSYK